MNVPSGGADKLKFTQSLNIFTNKLGNTQMLNFISGFILTSLNLDIKSKITSQIHEKILNLCGVIEDSIISRPNSIELLIEAASRAKKYKNNEAALVKQFGQSISILIGEIAGNSVYLTNKWKKDNQMLQEDNLSLQFIHKILQEESLLNTLKSKLQIECQICVTSVEAKDLGALQCGHMFHRQCLYQFIKSQIDSNRIDIKCPMEGCSKYLPINDILEFIDGETRQKFDKFCFNKYVEKNSKDTSWCPTAGCSSVFQFDELLTNYRCNSCKKHYCLKCKAIYHNGMSCAQYRINNSYGENDRKFQQFVKGAKYKQCPKCSFWVERVAGCNSMACRCGHGFCYDCGGISCPHGSCSNSGKR